MVRRGTKVGDAYIAVHADNRDWIRGVAKQRAALKKQWEENGEQAGDWFSKAWDREVSNKISRTWRDVIRGGVEQDFGHMERRWGSITEAVERTKSAINDMYRADRENNVITKAQHDNLLRNLYAWRDIRNEQEANAAAAKESERRWEAAARAQRARFLEQQRMLRDEGKLREEIDRHHEQAIKFDRRRARMREDIIWNLREQYRITGRLTKVQNEFVDKILRDHIDGIESYTSVFARMNRETRRIAREQNAWHELEEQFRKYYNVVGDLTQRQKEQIREIGAEVQRTGNTVARYFRTMERRRRIDDQSGLLFGRLAGSRNDFLNIVGRITAPLERNLSRVFARMFSSLGRLGPFRALSGALTGLVERLAEGGRMAQFFSRGLGSMLSFIPALAAAIPAVSVAIVAVITVASAAATLISGLGGMIAGVAASLTYGLGAALTSLLPILLAAGSGIAALVVGITGMSKSQKAALRPLEDWYESLSEMVARDLFGNLEEQVGGFINSVAPHLEEVLTESASAISAVIDGVIEKLGSPQFQGVMDTLDENLPGIVRAIGDSLSSLALGLLAVGSAISPKVEELLSSLSGTLSDWADWAASAEGQASIADWFDGAWESATRVWNVLTLVWDILGEIFASGKDEGDDWLQGWIDGLEEFLGFLQSPEGQEAMDNWYQKAVDIASSLGDLIDDLGSLYDTLDSAEGQAALSNFIDAMGNVADAINWVTGAVNGLNSILEWTKIFNVPTPGEEFIDWGGIWDSIVEGYNSLQAWWEELVAPINEWWGVDEWFDGLDFSGFWDSVRGFFEGIAEWLAKKALEMWEAGGNIVQGLIDGIVENLIPEPIKAAFRQIIDWVKGVFGIASPSTVMFQVGVDIVQGLINGILSMLAPLTTAGQSIVDTLDRIWNGGEGGFAGVVGRSLQEISRLVPGLDRILGQAGVAGKSGMQSLGTKMFNQAKPIPGRVGSALGPLDNTVAAAARAAANSGARGFSGFATSIVSVAYAAVSGLARIGGAMYSAGYSVGAAAGRGMLAGLNAYSGAVYSKAYSMGRSAVKAAKSALISQSPSKAMQWVGEDAVEGFIIPFRDRLAEVADASAQMAEAALAGLSPEQMYARGAAASQSLAAGIGDAISVSADVSAMLGPSPNAGRTTYISSGAIQINSNARTPAVAAHQMLDGLAANLVGES